MRTKTKPANQPKQDIYCKNCGSNQWMYSQTYTSEFNSDSGQIDIVQKENGSELRCGKCKRKAHDKVAKSIKELAVFKDVARIIGRPLEYKV